MKKGAVGPSKTSSSSTSATKIRSADSSRGQQTSKGLSTVLNRKTRSSQELESANSSKPSRATSKSTTKSFLERTPSLNECFSKYKVEDLTPREMHESLERVKENPVQPFTFLSNILDERNSGVHATVERTKPTEIDLQLAALKRRVQLNKSLMERTNEQVKEINFLVEKNSMMASRELSYDENESGRRIASGDAAFDSDSALKASCPGIMELQRTIEATKDMLGYVKSICNEEMQMTDLPKELADRMSADAVTKRIN